MKYGVNLVLGKESWPIYDTTRGQKNARIATWSTREAAQATVDHWRAAATWNSLSDPFRYEFNIIELTEESWQQNGTTVK